MLGVSITGEVEIAQTGPADAAVLPSRVAWRVRFAWPARRGAARSGVARLGVARLGPEGRGSAWRGSVARLGVARPDRRRSGVAGPPFRRSGRTHLCRSGRTY